MIVKEIIIISEFGDYEVSIFELNLVNKNFFLMSRLVVFFRVFLIVIFLCIMD